MSDFWAVPITFGLFGGIVLIAYIFSKYLDWKYARKERKFAEKYPELVKARKEALTALNAQSSEYRELVYDVRKEIEEFENEKIYLPLDILTQRTQEIEEKKKKLYEDEKRLDAKYEVLRKRYVELMQDPEE